MKIEGRNTEHPYFAILSTLLDIAKYVDCRANTTF